jgi:box C/D snoRNA protein 1
VEWLFEDGTRFLRCSSATETVEHAYEIAIKIIMRQRQPLPKAEEEVPVTDSSDSDSDSSEEDEDEDEDEDGEEDDDKSLKSSSRPTQATKLVIPETPGLRTVLDKTAVLNKEEPGHYFYLVKPKTSGFRRVLIPTDPKASLTDVLRHQTVVEFPSIQVLSRPPTDLPDTFLLESTYLKQLQIQDQEMEALVASEKETFDIGHGETSDIPGPESRPIANSDDLLIILQRDIMGV